VWVVKNSDQQLEKLFYVFGLRESKSWFPQAQELCVRGGDERTAGDELGGDVDALLLTAADAPDPDPADPCVHRLRVTEVPMPTLQPLPS